MNTPITDRLANPAGDFVRNTKVIHVSHAKKLELDRTALMEALQATQKAVAIRAKTSLLFRGIEKRVNAALATARANFPTP